MYNKSDIFAFNSITNITPFYALTKEEAILYLSSIQGALHTNAHTYDLIDYEKLIYIDIIYGKDEEVAQKLLVAKKVIVNNYIIKQRYLNRINLNND